MSDEAAAKPKPAKPLGHRAYGGIPHLPGSRRGPGDRGLSEQQAAILTTKARDRWDTIIVQEKLDGSNVSIANIDGEIVALTRAGYRADDSIYDQHHWFQRWVEREKERFASLLRPGERVVGEWLAQAHGTIYKLPHEPFVAFDIMRGHERTLALDVFARCSDVMLTTPRIIHIGGPFSIEDALMRLEPSGHGAVDGVEGAVWRCERKGAVDFLGKYVRPEKVDGKYLESVSGKEAVINWIESGKESAINRIE